MLHKYLSTTIANHIVTTIIVILYISSITLSSTIASEEVFKDIFSESCCYTNSCCWEIPKEAVTQLSDGSWIINSTQQHMPPAEAMSPKDDQLGHTVFSPDGKYYRCACDPYVAPDYEQSWIRHQGAKTRCLAIPMQGF